MALPTLNKQLQASGISDAHFLSFTLTGTFTGIAANAVADLATALGNAKPSVIWLPFQECQGVPKQYYALMSHIGKPYFRSYFVGLSAYDNGCCGGAS